MKNSISGSQKLLTVAVSLSLPEKRGWNFLQLTAALMFVVVSLNMPAALSETLSVPGDFSNIQTAIDRANSGDIVEVDIGTYRVNLVLRDNIDVRGVEAARTFLVASDRDLPIVTADSISNVLFTNFSLVESVDGISVINSEDITIASNVFNSLSGTALSVGVALDTDVINNVFRNNETAISRIGQATDIVNNIFSGNQNTIASSGPDPDASVSYNCFYQNSDLGQSGGDNAVGVDFQIGNPLYADTANRDFHLQESSICIDAGSGEDVIDDTVADMGAYGGDYADALPYPVAEPGVTDSSDAESFNITLNWDANLAYLITSDVLPGSYRVYYRRNQPGPPFDGTDAGDGTLPSPVDVGNVTSYTLEGLQPDSTTPGVPVLVSADPENQTVRLAWNAAANATGYTIYYGVTTVTENSLDVGNVTGFSLTGLENGIVYSFAIGAVTQPVYYLAVTAVDSTPDQNESDYSPEVSVAMGDSSASELSNVLTAMPEEIVPYPDLPDKGCFVATAAFGADWAAEVQVLRWFRDRYLLPHTAGRAFVGWYYRYGPVAAGYLDANSEYKPFVRLLLWPLVAFAAFLLGASSLVKLLALTMFAGLLLVVFRTWRIARSAWRWAP